MRKTLLIIAMLLMAASSWAVSIENTAGSLSTKITDQSMTSLTITGTMDARDFKYIFDNLNELTEIDLSGVTIEAYENSDAVFGIQKSYEAQTIPQTSFFGKKLTKVTFPAGLKAIGYAAFAGCPLTAIVIPETVDSIGSYAFSATNLTSITLPANVTKMGEGAFSECASLATASVAAGNVADYAFLGDTKLSDVTLGAAVNAIGNAAFKGCSAITNIAWPSNSKIESIGNDAFMGTNITDANLSNIYSLKSIGDWAFANTPITSATIPTNVTSVGEGAYYYTTGISKLILPTRVTKVSAYLVAGSGASNEDVLGSSVTEIGSYAFYNNAASTFVIPFTVNKIGTKAMAGMTSLTELSAKPSTVPELGDSVWAGVNQAAVALAAGDSAYFEADQWKEFNITVKILMGDVNNDGFVNVTDLSAMMNYILGKEISNFNFKAGDMDGNGTINVTDLAAIMRVILGQNNAPVKPQNAENTDDNIIIDDFNITPGETRTVEVKLNNSNDYSMLQFDLEMPNGLEVVEGSVASTSRAADHQFYAEENEGIVRIVGYNMTNSNFAGNEGAVLTLKVKASKYLASETEININNVVFTNAEAEGYYAPDGKANVGNTTGINEISNGNFKVYAQDGMLVIESAEATTAQMVAVNGIVRNLAVEAGHNEYEALGQGIYMVRIGGATYKVILK